MKYDIEANIISWELGKGKIVKVIELRNFLIHLGSGGQPLLVEVLNASKFKKDISKIKAANQISPAC